jgi:TonB family protein
MNKVFVRAICFAIAAGVATLPASASDWAAEPKPKFPRQALTKGSEGAVRLRVLLNQNGTVNSSTVTKSSGDVDLDKAAQRGVLKWKLKPTALKPADFTKGRDAIVEFKQEAPVAAIYPDRQAYFQTLEEAEMWIFAPFPSYPLQERQRHHTGTVWLHGQVGRDGRVSDIKLLQSSGYHVLDQCAVAALRLWRAHKQYAGVGFRMPIRFKMGGH